MPESTTPDQPPSRTVRCVVRGTDLPGLPAPPFPSALGQRIYDSVSLAAWQDWLEHSRRLINEHALRLSDPAAREFLQAQCEAFLFRGETAPPPGYVPRGGGFVPLVRKPPDDDSSQR